MSSGYWKRATVSLVAGALAAVAASPLTSLAASPVASVVAPGPQVAQFHGSGQCQLLGGGGLTSAGLQSGGLSQVYTLGAGAFYGPYYSPVYSGLGIGTIDNFLNFSAGQPSPLATLAASPLCQGLGITVPAPSGGPFVVRNFGLVPSPIAGYVGAGFGSFGMSPFGASGTGARFGGFGPLGFGLGSPFIFR